MAVIHRHDDKHCLILDQQQYLKDIYKNTKDARKSSSSESSQNLSWSQSLFNVVKPFRKGLNHNRKRKTNKKRTYNEAFDDESNDLLEKLKIAADFCRDRLAKDDDDTEPSPEEHFLDSIPFAEIATQNCDRLPAVRNITLTDYFLRASKLGIQVNIIYSHEKTEPSVVDTAVAGEILLPSQCRFLWSDIKNLKILIDEGRKYSFVVIDPPWSNKSVRRQRAYQWSDLSDIENLPIENLIDRDRPSLICCWSTNCDRIEKFVKEKLLIKWRCQYLSTWHWLKITRRGETVLDVESPDKKSYEILILACSADDRRFESLKTDPKIFCSVPALIHSAKPVLHPMFQNLIDFPRIEENFCLEIFARNLLPNFTSVGNEVLKNQSMQIFEKSQVQN